MKNQIKIVRFLVMIFFLFILVGCPDPDSTNTNSGTDTGGGTGGGGGGNVNNAPVISLTANPTIVPFGGTSTITCSASDADGDSLTYTFFTDSGVITGYYGPNAVWVAPRTTGNTIITCKVSDSKIETFKQVSIITKEWVLPTQFASSLRASDMIVDGVIFNNKLYLIWSESDMIGPTGSYLSVFDSDMVSAIEISRIEILSQNGTFSAVSSITVDTDGIYIGGGPEYGYRFIKYLAFDLSEILMILSPSYGTIGGSLITTSTSIYSIGDTHSQAPGFIQSGDGDILIWKHNKNGNLEWVSQWGTTGIDWGRNIEVKADGIYVSAEAGFTAISPPTSPPAYVGSVTLKYDFDGNLLSVTQP